MRCAHRGLIIYLPVRALVRRARAQTQARASRRETEREDGAAERLRSAASGAHPKVAKRGIVTRMKDKQKGKTDFSLTAAKRWFRGLGLHAAHCWYQHNDACTSWCMLHITGADDAPNTQAPPLLVFVDATA